MQRGKRASLRIIVSVFVIWCSKHCTFRNSTCIPQSEPQFARAPMKRTEYESVRTEEPAQPPGVDPMTACFAVCASVLSCVVSVAAIVYVVLSLRHIDREPRDDELAH